MADMVAEATPDQLRELMAVLPRGKASAGKAGGGKKQDDSRSGKAWRAGKQLIYAGVVTTAKELRVELAKDSDPDIVDWANEVDDRQMQQIIDKIGIPERWALGLDRNNGVPYANFDNTVVALSTAPTLFGMVALDKMVQAVIITRKISGDPIVPPRRLRDTDYGLIQQWLQRHAAMPRLPRETVIQAVAVVAEENGFNPLHDYLNGLVWDETRGLDNWLVRFAGAEDTPYVRMVGRMVLLSMVARAFEPGCQCDYVMVLEGEQGVQKSALLKALADPWFDDHLPSIDGKNDVRASMHLRGKWVVEISELHAFSRADIEKLKSFITRRVENFTPLHARTEVEEPRQGILIGTTNKENYLRDETGNRRFWPIKTGVIDVDGFKAARDQLFAEAVFCYQDGEPWWPTREFEEEHFRSEQENRHELDPWEPTIQTWLQGQIDGTSPKHSPRPQQRGVGFTMEEIAQLSLGVEIGRIALRESSRISAILKRVGWVTHRGAKGLRLWIPRNEEEQK